MSKYIFLTKASHPTFVIPGLGYVRKKQGELLELTAEQKEFIESPSFPYRDYFQLVGEKEDE